MSFLDKDDKEIKESKDFTTKIDYLKQDDFDIDENDFFAELANQANNDFNKIQPNQEEVNIDELINIKTENKKSNLSIFDKINKELNKNKKKDVLPLQLDLTPIKKDKIEINIDISIFSNLDQTKKKRNKDDLDQTPIYIFDCRFCANLKLFNMLEIKKILEQAYYFGCSPFDYYRISMLISQPNLNVSFQEIFDAKLKKENFFYNKDSFFLEEASITQVNTPNQVKQDLNYNNYSFKQKQPKADLYLERLRYILLTHTEFLRYEMDIDTSKKFLHNLNFNVQPKPILKFVVFFKANNTTNIYFNSVYSKQNTNEFNDYLKKEINCLKKKENTEEFYEDSLKENVAEEGSFLNFLKFEVPRKINKKDLIYENEECDIYEFIELENEREQWLSDYKIKKLKEKTYFHFPNTHLVFNSNVKDNNKDNKLDINCSDITEKDDLNASNESNEDIKKFEDDKIKKILSLKFLDNIYDSKKELISNKSPNNINDIKHKLNKTDQSENSLLKGNLKNEKINISGILNRNETYKLHTNDFNSFNKSIETNCNDVIELINSEPNKKISINNNIPIENLSEKKIITEEKKNKILVLKTKLDVDKVKDINTFIESFNKNIFCKSNREKEPIVKLNEKEKLEPKKKSYNVFYKFNNDFKVYNNLLKKSKIEAPIKDKKHETNININKYSNLTTINDKISNIKSKFSKAKFKNHNLKQNLIINSKKVNSQIPTTFKTKSVNLNNNRSNNIKSANQTKIDSENITNKKNFLEVNKNSKKNSGSKCKEKSPRKEEIIEIEPQSLTVKDKKENNFSPFKTFTLISKSNNEIQNPEEESSNSNSKFKLKIKNKNLNFFQIKKSFSNNLDENNMKVLSSSASLIEVKNTIEKNNFKKPLLNKKKSLMSFNVSNKKNQKKIRKLENKLKHLVFNNKMINENEKIKKENLSTKKFINSIRQLKINRIGDSNLNEKSRKVKKSTNSYFDKKLLLEKKDVFVNLSQDFTLTENSDIVSNRKKSIKIKNEFNLFNDKIALINEKNISKLQVRKSKISKIPCDFNNDFSFSIFNYEQQELFFDQITNQQNHSQNNSNKYGFSSLYDMFINKSYDDLFQQPFIGVLDKVNISKKNIHNFMSNNYDNRKYTNEINNDYEKKNSKEYFDQDLQNISNYISRYNNMNNNSNNFYNCNFNYSQIDNNTNDFNIKNFATTNKHKDLNIVDKENFFLENLIKFRKSKSLVIMNKLKLDSILLINTNNLEIKEKKNTNNQNDSIISLKIYDSAISNSFSIFKVSFFFKDSEIISSWNKKSNVQLSYKEKNNFLKDIIIEEKSIEGKLKVKKKYKIDKNHILNKPSNYRMVNQLSHMSGVNQENYSRFIFGASIFDKKQKNQEKSFDKIKKILLFSSNFEERESPKTRSSFLKMKFGMKSKQEKKRPFYKDASNNDHILINDISEIKKQQTFYLNQIKNRNNSINCDNTTSFQIPQQDVNFFQSFKNSNS